jgi:hypothetical protein
VYYNVTTLRANGVELDSLSIGEVTATGAKFSGSNFDTNSGRAVIQLSFKESTDTSFTIDQINITGLGAEQATPSTGLTYDAAADRLPNPALSSSSGAPGADDVQTDPFEIRSPAQGASLAAAALGSVGAPGGVTLIGGVLLGGAFLCRRER